MASLCPIAKLTNQIFHGQPGDVQTAAHASSYHMEIYDSIADAGKDWCSVVPQNDPYWKIDFLRSLEIRPPGNFQFRYIVFYHDKEPVGVAYAQITKFSAWQSIRGDIQAGGSRKTLFTKFRQWLAKQLNLNTLILGNTLVSGQYAYYFKPGCELSPKEIQEATEVLADSLQENGLPIHFIAIKDLDTKAVKSWNGKNPSWSKVCFQPRMVVKIDDRWNSSEDYLSDMQSKYRVRYRRARKKLVPVTDRRLSLDDIRLFQDEMYTLYLSVAEQSGFNLVELDKAYWWRLKDMFGRDFSVRGYFLDGKLVGFYSLLRGDHAIWHANYLGYDQQVNSDHQLYLNMLYDMVESAIEGKASELDFSRTALEIKSSVGAKPEELFCYFKHTHLFVNPLVPWLTGVIAPEEDWQPRHPFKEMGTEKV